MFRDIVGLGVGISLGCTLELDPVCYLPVWRYEIMDAQCQLPNGDTVAVVGDDLDTTFVVGLCAVAEQHAILYSVVVTGDLDPSSASFQDIDVPMREMLVLKCQLAAVENSACAPDTDNCQELVDALDLPFLADEPCAVGPANCPDSAGGLDTGTGETGMGGTATTSGGSEGTGADVTGVDVSSGGMLGAEQQEESFGDLDALLDCKHDTVCFLAPELVTNVLVEFQVVIDDGVLLVPEDEHDGEFIGLRITGLDDGEASTALANALGFEDGDVILRVNGMKLGSANDVAVATVELLQSEELVLQIERDGKKEQRVLIRKILN